ncbi:hypothetical protein KC19_7G085100 [Ceratodon purpureus]|uniref:Uncharacterized protein n=1 Tax=Ceratodon purpureus TaxID=3225 RepID=A0A8T0H669_CERPU|nr:hypothetical protein KC19_7G085100 [Ceratodon purpureus]
MDNSLVVVKKTARPAFDLEKELQGEGENQDAGRAGSSYEDEDEAEAFERRVSQPRVGSASSSSYPNPEDDITLGQFILDRVGDAFKGLFRNSQTILRVDLRQALRYDVSLRPLQRTSGTEVVPSRRGRGNGTSVRQPGRRSEAELDADAQSKPWSHGLQGGGARLKLMQIWEFKNSETGEDRLPLKVNFGFGANVLMDRGEVEPKLRIRTQNLALHFFPDPYLELRGKWPLADTNLAVCARYRVPVSSMKTIWESRSDFRVYLCHRSGRLFHLTPGGLEFEDPKIPFGQFGTMRLAASVDFPRQLPLQDGEPPFRFRIMRLGIKSRIM